MSFLWLAPTATLVLGTLLAARLVAELRREALDLEIDLAEAAEAFAQISDYGVELDGATARIESLLEAFASPLRAGSQTRRAVRHWWARARHSTTETHVVQ